MLLFKIDVPLMLVANGLWFWIKGINWSKGHGIDVWHMGDFRNFARVIAAEEDPNKRRRYRAILWALRISIFAVVLVMVSGAVLVRMSEAAFRAGR